MSQRPPLEISTVGELRASGHQQKSLREELRANLLAALAEGRDPWPGLHGFSQTVIPQLERALLAGHDVVLLGERGQGKTRILRTLVGLVAGQAVTAAVLLRLVASARVVRRDLLGVFPR